MSVTLQIRTEFKNEFMIIPQYMSAGAAGFDLQANLVIGGEVFVSHHEQVIIPTGIFVAIPSGYELQIRSRSGLAAKNGVFVVNSPGTVDSDYRGEIGVILSTVNITNYVVVPGERIAQAVLAKVKRVEWEEVEVLADTERGAGGFGSSGKGPTYGLNFNPITDK